jgi:hypothetical protein
LRFLIESLTLDLEKQQKAAQHWQQKVIELQKSYETSSLADNTVEASRDHAESSISFYGSLVIGSNSPSNCSSPTCSTCAYQPTSIPGSPVDLITTLHHQHSLLSHSNQDLSALGTQIIGKLHYAANPSLSIVNISLPNLKSNAGIAVNEATFQTVLGAIDAMAGFSSGPPSEDNPWPRIRHLKPDFSEEKARELCERLLREAVFTRNLSSNPIVAQSLLDGLLGSFGHFSTHNMVLAVVSLLEMSWQIGVQHRSAVHPSIQVYVALFSMVLAPSQSKRATWMARNMETLESSSGESCFQVLVLGYLGAAYYALLTHDEDSLLRYVTILDEILAPGTSAGEALEAWDVVNYHAMPSPSKREQPDSPTSNWLQQGSSFYHSSDSIRHAPYDPQAPKSASRSSSSFLPSTAFSAGDSDELFSSSSNKRPSYYLDENGEIYTPGENLKSLMRITVHLIRAEASLIFADHATCRHWVDEAEKTLLSIPLAFMFQRVLLMKNVMKTTCPFPTGTRTVVDEFERRMLQHDCARCECPFGDNIVVGGLWRTP